MKLRTLLLVGMILLSVVAVYSVAYYESQPTQQSRSEPGLAYQATTSFGYSAPIAPNALYNASEVTPGHGTLFASIVSLVGLSYRFYLNVSAAATVQLSVGQTVRFLTAGWNLTLNSTSEGFIPPTTGSSTVAQDSFTVNTSALLKEARSIENLTAYNPSYYDIQYIASIFAIVTGPSTSATLLATPVFTLNLSGLQQFAYWAPSNRTFAENATVPVTVSEALPSVTTDRAAALVFALLVLAGTGLFAYLSWTRPAALEGPKDPEAEIDRMTAPYKDAIAMTLSLPHRENIVVMRGWPDLIRAADMLSKPVLHLENRVDGEVRHIFYIVDGSVQYVLVQGAAERAATDARDPPAPPRRPTWPFRKRGEGPPKGASG